MALDPNKSFEITTGGFQIPFNTGLIGTYGWIDFAPLPSILITDYCERAKDRLIEQFEDKQGVNDYLCALVEPFQELEFVLGDLLSQRGLDVAVGTQLDGLGDIVGISRNGLNDSEYRTAIRFQIGVNFSNGEPESLITLTKNLTEATDVWLREVYPATVIITTDGLAINSGTIKLLRQSAPAGVNLELDGTYGEIPFAFAPEPGDIDPLPEGFSEPNYGPDAGKGGVLTEKFI